MDLKPLKPDRVKRIAFFHYHYLPAGVTQVAVSQAAAVLEHLPGIEEAVLVSGSAENLKISADKAMAMVKGAGISSRVTFKVIPEIAYLPEAGPPPDPGKISRILCREFPDTLFWVHNYHLGKNPFFTQALLDTARKFPEKRFVFQIHDFAECGRSENLEILRRHITGPLYPVLPNIRYGVINPRDLALLRGAGLPEDSVFLLDNPVAISSRPVPGRAEQLRKAGDAFRNTFMKVPSWNPEGKLVLYPVRTIRRKNVIEAGLLARLSRTPVNLLPTLPGVSDQEKPYSDLTASCFEEKLIPGLWKAGIRLGEAGLTFEDLSRGCDLVLSTSVQEGFGYFFINSVLWDTPILARRLDILEGLEDIFEGHPHRFYHSFPVPYPREKIVELRKSYLKRVEAIDYLPDEIRLKLREEMFSVGETIDFSWLSPQDQKQFLRELCDPGLLEETRLLNAPLLKDLEAMLAAEPVTPDQEAANRRRLEKRFGFRAHAESIGKVIASFGAASGTAHGSAGDYGPAPSAAGFPLSEDPIHRKVLEYFASPGYFRLLYEF